MTFDPNADISRGKASKRGRNTGIAGGGGLGVLALVGLSQLRGVDLTGLLGSGGVDAGGGGAASDTSLEQCLTGEDANENVECRMKGASASLEEYWQDEARRLDFDYVGPN